MAPMVYNWGMNKSDCFTNLIPPVGCKEVPVSWYTITKIGVDDRITPPVEGSYHNTMVLYKDTGNVYMFDTAGIPTLIKDRGSVDDHFDLKSKNPVQNKVVTAAVNELTSQIQSEIEAREEAVANVDNKAEKNASDIMALQEVVTENSAEIVTNSEDIAALQANKQDNLTSAQLDAVDSGITSARVEKYDGYEAKITKNTEDLAQLREDFEDSAEGLTEYTAALNERINTVEESTNKDVVTSVTVGANESTDVIKLDNALVNIKTGATGSSESPFPVASETSAGIMNSATFKAVKENSAKIDLIENATIALNDLDEDITQDELTQAWEEVEHTETLVNGAKIYDVANQRIWTYYKNLESWESISIAGGGEAPSVNLFTNTTAGIIKGSTTDGQIFAEANGTGSVNGWDSVKSDVSNNASAIEAINETLGSLDTNVSKKLDKVTSTSNMDQAYIKGSNGTQKMVNIGSGLGANRLLYASGQGQCNITTPTSENHIANKEYVDTADSNKQDKLTTAQLAAVDSGIDSTKVTKLNGIEAGAQVNVKPNWNAAAGNAAEILNKPAINNATTTFTYDGTTIGSTTANQAENGTIAVPVVLANNAGAHNALYRGKNLGTSVTTAQWNAIKNGTFDDMFIGDYWVINGVTWRIANFDYWLNTGDTATTAHHVVIVPDSHLYTAQMNTSNVTTGAYAGSKMHTNNLTTAKTTVNNAFGSAHILSHRTYLTSGVASDGRPNNGAWYSSTVDLMCETMVYGCSFFRTSATGSDPGATNRIYSVDTSQLALFRLDHSRICNRTSWWLRDVVSSATFAIVSNYGLADNNDASNSNGVRPAFAIYQA